MRASIDACIHACTYASMTVKTYLLEGLLPVCMHVVSCIMDIIMFILARIPSQLPAVAVHTVLPVANVAFNACRGVFLNHSSRLSYHPAYQIENTINYAGGSLCYIVVAVLSWTQVKACFVACSLFGLGQVLFCSFIFVLNLEQHATYKLAWMFAWSKQ